MGIADQINGADEETWKRLAQALGVASREEAAELCATNPSAAAKAKEILGEPQETDESLITRRTDESLLTKPARKSKPLADRMYGGGVTF